MPLALAEAVAGLLALAVLALLPGLMVVRSPWPFVPFFSLSFWLVSWGWLAPIGPGRERFLHVMLAFAAGLAALRLLKPLRAGRPTWPAAVVVGAALARLAPFGAWRAAPGLDAGFQSSSALLLTWRDGIPGSYLPLYSLVGFGAGDFGPSSIAADLSLLAGLAPHRSLLVALLASEGLLVLALYAFARRHMSAASAALGSVATSAVAFFAIARTEGDVGTPLALALSLAGSSLVLRGEGRSTTIAAGLFWAGALVTLGIPGAIPVGVVTVVAVAVAAWPDLRRIALAGALAALLAAPTLWRTSYPMDVAGRRFPPLALALPVAAAILLVRGSAAPWERRRWAVPALGAVILGATLGDWTLRTARVRVTVDDLAAAAWLREHSHPTDLLCADDEVSRAWIPALAGRASHPGRLPGSRIQPFDGATCRFRVLRGAASDIGPPAAFRRGAVALVIPR